MAGGCSLASRKEQAGIRDLYQKGQIDEAMELLDKSEFKSNDKNRLLYLLQKGRLLLAQDRPYASAQVFVEASELMDKLYTKSVREALLTSVSNDNNETYYGSPYERSLLYFYQAQSFLKVYQKGHVSEEKKVAAVEETKESKEGEKKEASGPKNKIVVIDRKLTPQERRRYLFKARASIVAWDVFYKDLQRSSREGTVFDHDLFAKIAGGQIHELIGKRSDDQIALQLYKDAYDILHKIGPAFKSFNENYESFSKDLMGEKALKGKEKKRLTENFHRLDEYLKLKILDITKRRRRYEYNKIVKKLSPSKETLKEVGKKRNVTILLEDGVVAPLIGEDFSYNLKSALNSVDDPSSRALLAGIGLPVITYFAMGPLGLASASTSGNRRLYVRHNVGELMVAEAGVEFEMPVIKEPEAAPEASLEVYKIEGKKESLIAKSPLALAGPVSDLAYQMNLERASSSFSDRGARIAMKHVLAIIAAYQTYQSVKRNSDELFAKPAALATYLLAAKTIKESERADTRQWSTLPSQIFLAEFQLRPGEYKLRAVSKDLKKPIEVGKLTVQSTKKDIFSYRLP